MAIFSALCRRNTIFKLSYILKSKNFYKILLGVLESVHFDLLKSNFHIDELFCVKRQVFPENNGVYFPESRCMCKYEHFTNSIQPFHKVVSCALRLHRSFVFLSYCSSTSLKVCYLISLINRFSSNKCRHFLI